ncbi:hypothetical protein MTO96_037173, partial [Rhipicephalus appendiculatus]
TPLQQGNSINGAVNALSLMASSSRSASGNSWAKHWLLVFDYGEDKVLICDADNLRGRFDGSHELEKEGCAKNLRKQGCNDFDLLLVPCKRVPKYLAKRNIPKERIDQLLRKMCDCGQYHYTENNCQKWVQDLLRELDIEMPADEVDARTVVTNYIQPTAMAGATILGAGLVGALIYGAVSRQEQTGLDGAPLNGVCLQK